MPAEKQGKESAKEGYDELVVLEELEAAREIMKELGLKTSEELEKEIERRHAKFDEEI